MQPQQPIHSLLSTGKSFGQILRRSKLELKDGGQPLRRASLWEEPASRRAFFACPVEGGGRGGTQENLAESGMVSVLTMF